MTTVQISYDHCFRVFATDKSEAEVQQALIKMSFYRNGEFTGRGTQFHRRLKDRGEPKIMSAEILGDIPNFEAMIAHIEETAEWVKERV